MHRHGYKGRKFNRETDQRRALIRSLICALYEHGSITTTLARAKEIRRPAEKLITIAKKSNLQSRRIVISRLDSIKIGNLLVDQIAPQLKHNSGYLKIERAGFRRGDNAEMGTISFVYEINYEVKKKAETKAEKTKSNKPTAKKTKEEK